MTQKEKRSFHPLWAVTAVACFLFTGTVCWLYFDEHFGDEFPVVKESSSIRRTGREAKGEVPPVKMLLMAAALAAFGVHATAKTFGGKGDEVLFPDK